MYCLAFDIVDAPLPVKTKPTPKTGRPRGAPASHAVERQRAHVRVYRARQQGMEPDPKDISEGADFAQTVTNLTMKAMRDGKAEPTIRDGLQAQALLDKRAEKAEDRRFMLNLARALAGGGLGTPELLLPEPMKDVSPVIEGEYEESLLAPAHLREG